MTHHVSSSPKVRWKVYANASSFGDLQPASLTGIRCNERPPNHSRFSVQITRKSVAHTRKGNKLDAYEMSPISSVGLCAVIKLGYEVGGPIGPYHKTTKSFAFTPTLG